MMFTEAIADKLIDVGSAVIKNESLEVKSKILCAISSSLASYCTHCHGQFVGMARRFGLDEEGIGEAEAIGARMRERCANESGLYRLNP